MTKNKAITPQQQPKFAGIKTYMRLPNVQVAEEIDFAVVGVPWDGATSYRTGQRLGNDAIRKVSVTSRPYNLAQGVGIFEHCSGVDYGDVSVVPGYNPRIVLKREQCHGITTFQPGTLNLEPINQGFPFLSLRVLVAELIQILIYSFFNRQLLIGPAPCQPHRT